MTGEVNAPYEPSPERLAAQVQEQDAAVRRAAEQVGELTVSAVSVGGLVRVEVGAQGQLRSVLLGSGVYDRMSAGRLAAVITELARGAAAEAVGQAQEIMAPVLPGGLPAGQEWWEWLPDVAFPGGIG